MTIRSLSYYLETTSSSTADDTTVTDDASYDNDDNDDDYSSSTFVQVAFIVLAVSFWLLAYIAARVTWSRSEFKTPSRTAIHVMLPSISILLGLECLLFFVNSFLLLTPGAFINRPVAIILYVLESLVAPGLFLSTFAVTFLAYRIRGMPFCFVRRNNTDILVEGNDVEGLQYQNADTKYNNNSGGDSMMIEPLIQPRILVLGMRVFAALLAVLSILIHLDVVFENGSDLAGRTGWSSVFTGNVDGSHGGSGSSTAIAIVHVCLGLLPMTLTCTFCMYFAILLWRYGNDFAMTIYTSFCNPWISPLFGMSAMITGQLFGPSLFPLMSNLGVFLYLLSILWVLLEIRRDMEQAVDDLGAFLSAVWGESTDSSSPSTVRTSKAAAAATKACNTGNNTNDDNKTIVSSVESTSGNHREHPLLSSGFL
jgi:hypothetical protein